MARPLPVVPRSCSLDEAGLAAQAARYRRAGEGALVVGRESRRLVVVLGPDVDSAEVAELVAVERDCCPFFEIGWWPEERRLSFSVASDSDAPALGAIAFALGL
ncbi:hypothetical protein BH20ACT15_BH20ACT15_16000 [soil metagenome]